MAELPELAKGLPALQRALAGSVLRPWCHFELPASTYLAQGLLTVSCIAAKLAGCVLHWRALCAACLACVMLMYCMQVGHCNQGTVSSRKVTCRRAARVKWRRARDGGPRLYHQSAGNHVFGHKSAHHSFHILNLDKDVQRMCYN